ncbi:MAG: ComF family protein [Myxococcales bacterium]|nr:ComF family protein [Myxococcales bacterium]
MLEIIRGFVRLTWPRRCAACGEPCADAWFCGVCGPLVAPRDGPRCVTCDAALPTLGPAHRCGRCLERPPPFERAWGVFDYAGPVGDAVRRGKYGREIACLRAVARVAAAALPDDLRAEPPDRVVPVPLHPRRLRQRGFAPPLVVAHAVARALRVPLARRALRRVVDTPEQAGLGDTARRRNVRRAFRAQGVDGLDVLVVDDVLTTGATAAAVAEALRRAGATRVRVLAAACVDRAP